MVRHGSLPEREVHTGGSGLQPPSGLDVGDKVRVSRFNKIREYNGIAEYNWLVVGK